MLHLDARVPLNERTFTAMNLTDRFGEEDLKRIGAWVYEGYKRDGDSRIQWERRSQAALDLALQVVVDKTFPWPGAANVAFPLVTIAAMQFHARAYPAIVGGGDLVKYRIAGGNPTPDEQAMGDMVADIMNQQLMEEDSSWEEQEDRLLLVAAIMGTAFKKSYYDADHQRTMSELVMPTDLVLDHNAKSVEGCYRKTHKIPMHRNEIYERVQKGLYKNVLEESWYCGLPPVVTTDTSAAQDKRKGVEPPLPDETTPFMFLEQHCWMDFDGDGYAEPYIITIEEGSHCVIRIVSRVDRKEDIERKSDGRIIKITATEYFTKRGFIPSPDGGIMDIGFGVLLGPINESVSTVLNQLLDQGTMLTTGGGFLGRGAKIRGGSFTFAPNQWIRVDATGDDLAKSIVQNPVREPSNVLFQLLGLLIEYANRISSATDMMVGENPGQNTPAQTSQTMVEQGMKLYSAIFKRQWRGLKNEFKKIYKLNATYLPTMQRQYFLSDPNRIVPSADPNIVSDNHRLQQAQAVKQAAMSTPGYDLMAVENFYLKSLKVDDADILYPKDKSKIPPLPNPKMQVEQMKMQMKQAELKQKQMQFIMSLQDQAKLTQAKIIELQARSMKEVAEAKGVQTGHQIAAFEATLGLLKAHDESLRGHIELAMKGMEDGQGGEVGGGVPGMEAPPGNQGSSGLPILGS
jgi:chaperonin GroES